MSNMTDRLVQAVKLAKESLQDLGLDDVEKQVALAKAIDYFLEHKDDESIPLSRNNSSLSPKDVGTESFLDERNFWSNLEASSGVKSSKLKDIFSIKGNQITLVLPKIKGDKTADKQCNVALLILYAYTGGLKMEWVAPSLVVESLRDFGVHATNFSRNLDRQNNWFRKKGIKKGQNYKLSGVGISEAKVYLASL